MEVLSALLAFCEVNPPVTGQKGPVMLNFDALFNVSMNKQLHKL